MLQPMGSTVFIIPSDIIKSSGIINPVDPLASVYNLYLYEEGKGRMSKYDRPLFLKVCSI